LGGNCPDGRKTGFGWNSWILATYIAEGKKSARGSQTETKQIQVKEIKFRPGN
jgi:hypothetical protein